MRPYLETEIIKIKKQKYKCREVIKFMGKKYEVFIKDGEVSIKRHKHQIEPKGNWINGENLDKIKFPCFCSYGGNRYGIITRTKANEAFDNEFYTLHGIEKQHGSFSSIRSYYNFQDLIRVWDIHILKGKIILFEEEENDKYDIDIEEVRS